jgi:hypothetical protein
MEYEDNFKAIAEFLYGIGNEPTDQEKKIVKALTKKLHNEIVRNTLPIFIQARDEKQANEFKEYCHIDGIYLGEQCQLSDQKQFGYILYQVGEYQVNVNFPIICKKTEEIKPNMKFIMADWMW